MPILKAKPARDYPNINAVQAVRGQWSVAAPAQSLPLTPGVWVPVGTIPANCFINGAEVGVSTGGLAAGATLDVQAGEFLPTDALVTAQSLDAAGVFVSPDASAGLGYRKNRSIIFARLTSALPLTAGAYNVIVSYYAKQD